MAVLGGVEVSYGRGTPVRAGPLFLDAPTPLQRFGASDLGNFDNSVQGFKLGEAGWTEIELQGYLTHKKTLNPLGSPQDPRQRPTTGS